MPLEGEKIYSDADVDRIVARRLKEQADAVKAAGIDKELQAIGRALRDLSKRADEANHLKAEMVTKLEFQAAIADLNHKFAGLITIEELGGNEIWVKAGVPHGLTREEIDALLSVAEGQQRHLEAAEKRQKFHETLWGRVAIISGAVIALMTVIQTIHSLVAGGAVNTVTTHLGR